MLLYILLTLVAVLAGLAAAFILGLLWVTSRYPKTNVPQPPGRSMIWGHLPALMSPTDARNPLYDASFAYWQRKLGSIVAYDLPLPAAVRMLIISDLDLIKQIIADDPPKADYNIGVFLGEGLVITSGDVWRHDRRLLNPAFNKRFLRDFVFPTVLKHASTLTEKLEQVEPYDKIDVNDYFRRMTLDIITEATMGRDYGLQKTQNHPLLTIMIDLFNEMSDRQVNPLRAYNPWSAYLLHKNLNRFNRHCANIIQEEKERMEKESHSGQEQSYDRGILSVMLGKDEDGSVMPLNRVIDNIKTFLFAGHDTTSTLLAFAVAMVSTHKEIETKVLKEIDSVLGDRDVPTHDDLSRLPYLKMVLKETLRMYPPAATARRLPVGYKVGDYVVDYPKTDVVISSYVVHHDPKLWDDPEIFDPERFNEDNSKRRPPLAYIPFLAGNRNCIGQHMALLEATVACAMIFKKFTFRMAYGYVPNMAYHITNVCYNGMQMFVFKRDHSKPSLASDPVAALNT